MDEARPAPVYGPFNFFLPFFSKEETLPNGAALGGLILEPCLSLSLTHSFRYPPEKTPLCDYSGPPFWMLDVDPATKRVLSFHGEKEKNVVVNRTAGKSTGTGDVVHYRSGKRSSGGNLCHRMEPSRFAGR